MPRSLEPTYTDLVHEVLRESSEPLPFASILERVGLRRETATRNPKATVRNALSQSHLLISLGDGRYGYVPRLVSGSLLRVVFSEKRPADHPLAFTDELLHALWPDFFEPEKRKLNRQVVIRLPSGAEAALALKFISAGAWGSPMHDALRSYLVESRAAAGDSLLVRIVDGERGACEGWFESRLKRDQAAVSRRNAEVAEAARTFLTRKSYDGVPIWEIATALLVGGLYRSELAPDTLERVLASDPRFVSAGFRIWTLAERVTPDDLSLFERRKEMEAEPLSLRRPEPTEMPTEIEPAAGMINARRAMERAFSDIQALLSEQELDSPEEIDAFLTSALAGGELPRRKAMTPLEQAQDLMYEAWDAGSGRERIRLARRALEISPDCADAYVLLAEETARGVREAADLYAKGVAAGERALGAEFLKAEAGHFWGIVETRPYMRARLGLAQALWGLGKQREAIDHLWAMLDLNPGDNQGIRYALLDWLLTIGDDASVPSLLDRYRDDAAASWALGEALHAFRTEGDSPRARKLLAAANESNRHVATYLLGRRRVPRALPEAIELGGSSEAVTCAAGQIMAWKGARGALEWLGRLSPHS